MQKLPGHNNVTTPGRGGRSPGVTSGADARATAAIAARHARVATTARTPVDVPALPPSAALAATACPGPTAA